jgi:hypothetical protein
MEGTEMSDKETDEPVILKTTMNPKNRGNFVELKDIDLDSLSEREKILYRVINDLEKELEKKK